MANEWIKMRPALLTDPKVNRIAKILETDRSVSAELSAGLSGAMSEYVTRNVMRYVTVAALLAVWGAANEHTEDGVFKGAELTDLDDIAGIPGFGCAMSTVGWAEYDAESGSVILPNFNEYNTSGKQRSSAAAERQRRYRERKASQESVTNNADSDVTRDVTQTIREEKRREEKKEETPPNPRKRGREPSPTLGVDFLLTEGVSETAARDWLAVRAKKRAPLTETAWRGIVREAQRAGITPAKAVEIAAEKGWQGFEAAWIAERRANGAAAHPMPSDQIVGKTRSLEELGL